MMITSIFILTVALVVSAALTAPVCAAEASLEPRLMRLAKVFGSLHFLHNLCDEKEMQ